MPKRRHREGNGSVSSSGEKAEAWPPLDEPSRPPSISQIASDEEEEGLADTQASFTQDRADTQASFTQDRADTQASFAHDRADTQASFAHDRADTQVSFAHDRADTQVSFAHDRANTQASFAHGKLTFRLFWPACWQCRRGTH
ncbi:hypothetical protein FHG87_024027 [Trinorchestia longiramus]|nr:hypothetical protein FHG87_024027 [Trinorchestia longiramus]